MEFKLVASVFLLFGVLLSVYTLNENEKEKWKKPKFVWKQNGNAGKIPFSLVSLPNIN